jgi:acetylornithine deacetylase
MQLGLNVQRGPGNETALTPEERRVCDEIAAGESELVDLLCTLIGFDTTTHIAGDQPRDEAALQQMLAERLGGRGADVRVWEPDPTSIAGHPMVPEGFTFAGRPQLAGRFRGTGGGRSLLLNGHIDVIAAEPREDWRHPPFAGVVADGAVHGRGSCDMKGGVASMVFAAETLARLGVPLAGDLIVNTVSEEESTGAGGLAMARTIQADAAIVPEPSGLDVWVACRGSLLPTITVEGRAGHAGLPPRPPEEGGAVNAIEKMALVLHAIAELRREWQRSPAHPFLSPGDVVPTIVAGGEWIVSYPALCRLDCHIEYLPGQADEHGWGSLVEQEFTEWILRATAADPWLAAHPPRIEWLVGGVPPAEVPLDDPIVTTALDAARAVGRPSELGGLENWHDGATLIVEAGIPSICLGPGDINVAHTIDESVPVADLVACAQAIAVTAMRFCR